MDVREAALLPTMCAALFEQIGAEKAFFFLDVSWLEAIKSQFVSEETDKLTRKVFCYSIVFFFNILSGHFRGEVKLV